MRAGYSFLRAGSACALELLFAAAMLHRAGMTTGASMYRYYSAVNDDSDLLNLKKVIWAM